MGEPFRFSLTNFKQFTTHQCYFVNYTANIRNFAVYLRFYGIYFNSGIIHYLRL